MAVVHTSWIQPQGRVITNGEWQPNDMLYRIHEQLQAFVTAVNDPDFTIFKTPNDSTSKSSGYCAWFFCCNTQAVANNGATPFGLILPQQVTGYGNLSWYNFYNHSESTSNYGYGTFSTMYSSSNYQPNLRDYDNTVDIIWDASGPTPWFVWFSTKSSLDSTRYMYVLEKADVSGASAGAYLPEVGVEWSPWFFTKTSVAHTSQSGGHNGVTAQQDTNAPYKGTYNTYCYRGASYPSTVGVLYPFWRPVYGYQHWLGNFHSDWYVSQYQTGGYGDTTLINGRTYMNFHHLWVPIDDGGVRSAELVAGRTSLPDIETVTKTTTRKRKK